MSISFRSQLPSGPRRPFLPTPSSYGALNLITFWNLHILGVSFNLFGPRVFHLHNGYNYSFYVCLRTNEFSKLFSTALKRLMIPGAGEDVGQWVLSYSAGGNVKDSIVTLKNSLARS